MAVQRVQATINVKSENFQQILGESIVDSSTGDVYEGLIAANERLKSDISKIFTEFVNKARAEQETNADQKKRKIKHDDDEIEDDIEDGDDDDAGSSDNNEEDQE
ncbi:unnamed protein product [Adineta steineri]|uniref:Uncharacterized protein n=1 Tax=Adineta steineri TaxID=433720 RepID=A0A818TIM8_9BILA|nr:unnamed protein product [Adineta steineri]CAF3685272.1 unnamed protein product [Adineta steineri]